MIQTTTPQKLLAKYHLRPHKGLGQNFLSDDTVLSGIADAAGIPEHAAVLEVGPGLGAVGPVQNFAGYGFVGKIVLSFLMLFGRLELLPMFILFTRSAWKKY